MDLTSPPQEWFASPPEGFGPGSPVTVTSEGRFAAWSHEWDRSHIGTTADGDGWSPPRESLTGYRMFHQGSLVCADGESIDVGVVPLTGGHAPDGTVQQAMEHYGQPERVRVVCRAVADETGLKLLGAVTPGTTEAEIAMMRRSALSGDWRYLPEYGGMEWLGSCFVAKPGLPVLSERQVDEAFDHVIKDFELVAASGRIVRAYGKPTVVRADSYDDSGLRTELGELKLSIEALQSQVNKLTAENVDAEDIEVELPES